MIMVLLTPFLLHTAFKSKLFVIQDHGPMCTLSIWFDVEATLHWRSILQIFAVRSCNDAHSIYGR